METIDNRYCQVAARRDAVAACATCLDLRMAARTVAAAFPASMETIHTGDWKISFCAAISCSRAVLSWSQDSTWRWLSPRSRAFSPRSRCSLSSPGPHVDFVRRDWPVRCPQSAGRQGREETV